MKKIAVLFLTVLFTVSLLSSVYADEAPKPSVVTSRTEGAESSSLPEDEAYIGEVMEEPENVNPLTGVEGLSEEAVGKRPVAVMINNHPDNYPQYNIGQADVIFEMVVEHDLTRFMGLFADYRNVPYLVSIRSYRYYFPAISNGFDAFYIHWGEDLTMMWYYDQLGLDSYDGISNTFLFGRDAERLDYGYSLEHASCLYGYLIPEQIAYDGKRTELDDAHKGDSFNFVPYGTFRVPGNEACRFLYVNYGEQTTQFTYNEEKGVYEKFANEEPQIDGISGEQLEFENVIVLYTEISSRTDEPEVDRKNLDVFGGLDKDYAKGYYISEGSVQPIRWAKADESARLRFFDVDGKEITINRGKTYITFTYIDSAELSDTIPEKYLY